MMVRMANVMRWSDPLIILVVFSMLGLGLLGILTAGFHLNISQYFFFVRQLLYIGIGLSAFAIGMSIDYRLYRFKTHFPFLVAIALLAAVFAFGRQSWLNIGGGFHIQPSEIAKLIIIVYLAYVMSFDRRGGMQFWAHSMPIMLTCGLLIVLTALQPDFGTALVMSCITLYMLFIGSIPIIHLLGPMLCTVPFILTVPFLFPHVRWRIVAFLLALTPNLAPWKLGYHDYQLRLAMGSGGLFGTGFGKGLIKRSFLPASHTDSIFAVLVEEGGFLTGLAIICLFLALFLLGERTARYASDRFGALLARGIAFYLALQGFLNISVCLGLFPNTGVTLPLYSYGGSSLIVTLYALGVLVNISSQRRIRF